MQDLTPIFGANAVTGGATTQMQGGRFEDGFVYSGLSKAADVGYRAVVEYNTNPLPGGSAVDKFDLLSPPAEFANNVGKVSQFATTNPCFLCEGGPVSRFANQIPIINAAGGLHDQVQNYMLRNGGVILDAITNVPTMPLAAGFTYTALLNGPLSVQLAVDKRN